jgi:hypothetical protein
MRPSVKNLPTQEYLNECFRYDPKTGYLYRKIKTANCVNIGDRVGGLDRKGYSRLSVKNKRYFAHRIIWCMIYGSFPPEQIDHQNHIRSDNRIGNLCLATNEQNSKNRSISGSHTSGVIGVGWRKDTKRWTSRITVSGKRINLGFFTDKSEAIKARAEANIKYGFHKNHGSAK